MPTTPSLVSPPPSSALVEDGEDRTISFSSVKDLFSIIEEMVDQECDTLIVQDVDQQAFRNIERKRNERRGFRFRRYEAARRLLVITIPLYFHEASHGELYQEVTNKISRMELRWSWDLKGATTFKRQQCGDDSGEGDSTGGPYPERAGDRWPTLIIESGVSESLPELRRDAVFWFDISQNQVKTVVLVKL